jgi:hypothetical protein
MSYTNRLAVALLLLFPLVGNESLADSDGDLTCGSRFAVFDKFTPRLRAGRVLPGGIGRNLNIVALRESGPLAVTTSIELPQGQPHHWFVTDSRIVLRWYNGVSIYAVDATFEPHLLGSFDIDLISEPKYGNRSVELAHSILRVFGLTRTLELDLETCTEKSCEPREVPFTEPPNQRYETCSVKVGASLFSEVRTETQNVDGIIYHDRFLIRRKTFPESRDFEPNSILFVTSDIETID